MSTPKNRPGLTYSIGSSKAAARIRAAAAEIFAAKGYGTTTTREIAASLDLSPGAVYPHYKTKESLLFAIAVDGHRRVLGHIEDHRDPTTTPSEQLHAVTAAFVRWHADHRAIARVIQHELRSLTPEHLALVADIRRATTDVFDAILRDGIASGEFAAPDPTLVTLAATSLGIDVSRWFPSKTHADADALAEQYADIVARMAGAGPAGAPPPGPVSRSAPRIPA